MTRFLRGFFVQSLKNKKKKEIKVHQKSSNQVGNGKRQGQKRFPAGKG
jgi:hypothetical protein